MALKPDTNFAGKINPATSAYPYGSARNVTTQDDGTGTPFIDLLINDNFGWQQALLDEAGIVPSGSPDSKTTSQYMQAFKKVLAFSGQLVFNSTADFSTGILANGVVLSDDEVTYLLDNELTVKTNGFYSGNTNGNATYKFLNSADSAAAGYVDGISRFQIRSLDVYACLVVEKSIFVPSVGAGGGVSDDTANIQAALDLAYLAGIVDFGGTEFTYLMTGNQGATLSAKAKLVGSGAEIVSENSSDIEVTTGGAFNPFILLNAASEGAVVEGLIFRGGLLSVQTKRFTAKGCKFYNLHNVGIGGSGSIAPERWLVHDCEFKHSLDTSVGNFSAVSRGGSFGVDPFGGTVIVDSCTFEGLAGGVNMHNIETLIVVNSKFKGGDVNHIKIDEGVRNLIIKNVEHDGAAINGASANRHLNTETQYAGFLNAGTNEVNISAILKNMTGTAGYDCVNTTILRKTTANINAEDCSVPVWSRCGGYLELILDVENCGSGAVEIAYPIGVWATNQTVRGTLKDSQIVVGNSSTNIIDYKRIDIKVDIDYSGSDGAIKAVDVSPTAGFEVDEVYVHDSHVKVGSGTGIAGFNGNFNLLVSATNTYEGASTNFTGRYEFDYVSTGSGNFPIVRRGTYRWRNTGGAITRTIVDANANVGDSIELLNDGSGTLSIVASGGTIDGFGTTQISTNGALTIKKTATSNVWQSTASRGTITQF